MKKSKVKIVKDKDLADMFNQMIGAGTINMNVVYPKYVSIRDHVEKLLNILDMLRKSAILKIDGMERERNDMGVFVDRCRVQMGEVFSMDFSSFEWNLNLVEDADRDAFGKVYENVKKSDLVGAFIIICNDLCPYKKYFENPDKLDAKFVFNVPGDEFNPFPFAPTFNVKQLLETFQLSRVNESAVRFMMVVLNKLYVMGHSLYKILMSPDIDVDEFVNVIMSNLEEVKKRIPRCEKAFDKIVKSVHMLKDNFGAYYHDFVETNNSTIIMENFVIDVSRNTKADAETTRQFRTIIEYYRKISQNQIKNPKIKKLFDTVSENFRHLEKHENLLNIDRVSDDSSDGDKSDDNKQDEDPDKEIKERNMQKSVDELADELSGEFGDKLSSKQKNRRKPVKK